MTETCAPESRCCGGRYWLPHDEGVRRCGMCARTLVWRCIVHHGLWPPDADRCPWRGGKA